MVWCWRERQNLIAWEKAVLASIWRLGLELKLVGLEASYSGLLVGQAGPPSSHSSR